MKGGAAVEDLHRREIHRVLVSTSVHRRSLQVPRFLWCIPGTHRRPNVGELKLPPRPPTHGNGFQAITVPWRLEVGDRGDSKGHVYTPQGRSPADSTLDSEILPSPTTDLALRLR